MHAAALRVELRLFDIHSLKEKRSLLKALIRELQKKYEVSAAEVDHQDKWRRATIGIAIVAPQAGHLSQRVHRIRKAVAAFQGVELLEYAVSYLEEPG